MLGLGFYLDVLIVLGVHDQSISLSPGSELALEFGLKLGLKLGLELGVELGLELGFESGLELGLESYDQYLTLTSYTDSSEAIDNSSFDK
jgi:hypothetical protein